MLLPLFSLFSFFQPASQRPEPRLIIDYFRYSISLADISILITLFRHFITLTIFISFDFASFSPHFDYAAFADITPPLFRFSPFRF
jgi:hypothetical protein